MVNSSQMQTLFSRNTCTTRSKLGLLNLKMKMKLPMISNTTDTNAVFLAADSTQMFLNVGEAKLKKAKVKRIRGNTNHI